MKDFLPTCLLLVLSDGLLASDAAFELLIILIL